LKRFIERDSVCTDELAELIFFLNGHVPFKNKTDNEIELTLMNATTIQNNLFLLFILSFYLNEVIQQCALHAGPWTLDSDERQDSVRPWKMPEQDLASQVHAGLGSVLVLKSLVW
jgi:hypothetical protein